MGCFLGCLGGEKDHKRRKHRINRGSPQAQRNRVKNVQQEFEVTAEQIISETPPTDLVNELLNKPKEEKRLSPSPSPRKKVTFNSNVTTYEHISVQESIDSLPQFNTNIEKENEAFKRSNQSNSLSEDDNSVISSVGSFPQNHRYHNARNSDDESEEYGDSDLDDEYDYEDSDEDINVEISSQKVWSESVLIESDESNVQKNPSADKEVGSPMVFGPKSTARDGHEYVNSVLNPVENITQWKAAKSKGTTNPLKPQKENFSANFEAPHLSFVSEPTVLKSKSDKSKTKNQEMGIDASLSNWLVSPESYKTTSSVMSFEDRPILGVWAVDELKYISASSSPRKSPARSPDEMPIIGTVGTYWNQSGSGNRSDSGFSSYKGIPNTTSKYMK